MDGRGIVTCFPQANRQKGVKSVPSRDDAGWTLERLIDFEQALSGRAPASSGQRAAASDATRGIAGAAARRRGLKAWLDHSGRQTSGKRFTSALGIVTFGLAVVLFSAGVTGALGLLDHERSGINVTLFLAILIGVQWLVLVLAILSWLLRRRAAEGFSMIQSLAGRLARKIAGSREEDWWEDLMDVGGSARAALLWRLARLVQTAGIAFNLGILCGLTGLVLLRHVGFYWETTTELAMRTTLEKAVAGLSFPWASWWPGAVPGSALIQDTLWSPGPERILAPGPAAWWEFLLAVTIFWGLLPRVILWLAAWRAGRKALESLDFQSRRHRALWRELTGTDRQETDEKPLDGVLVLDVGGSGMAEAALRPFLLRRLRVHPASWQSIAVLDAGAEAKAAQALAQAPAGVVLLAEGWSLSPPRMADLHRRIRATAGPDSPVKFLVANEGRNREPLAATADERREWAKFVDGLRDPSAEVYFYEPLQAAL